MPFKPREAQTRIKHAIVEEYVGAWCGIIASGIGNRPITIDFAYAEGFAGKGQYDYDVSNPQSGPVDGSPLIALAALQRASRDSVRPRADARVTGLLVERDVDSASELSAHLASRFGRDSVHESNRIEDAPLGSISVIADDFRLQADGIVTCLPETAFLLGFIDPFGTSASLEALAPLVRRPRTDLIIYFPSHEIQLHAAGINSPHPEPQTVANVQRVTDVYGADEWITIAREISLSVEERIERYAALYQERLRTLGRNCWVKSIALRFSSSPLQTPGYHLFLVTEDADGAMRMNDILRKAEIRKHVERLQDMEQRIRSKGNLELPLGPVFQEPEPDIQPDVESVANDVLQSLEAGSGCLEWKQLKGRLADSVYREGEIKRALTYLRTVGSIAFSTPLRKRSIIRMASD